jgi:hypothetical protein
MTNWHSAKLLRVSAQNGISTEVLFPATAQEFVPRTPLGKALLALRTNAIKRGMTLLSEAEVLDEVKKRRGGFQDDAKDIP